METQLGMNIIIDSRVHKISKL